MPYARLMAVAAVSMPCQRRKRADGIRLHMIELFETMSAVIVTSNVDTHGDGPSERSR